MSARISEEWSRQKGTAISSRYDLDNSLCMLSCDVLLFALQHLGSKIDIEQTQNAAMRFLSPCWGKTLNQGQWVFVPDYIYLNSFKDSRLQSRHDNGKTT